MFTVHFVVTVPSTIGENELVFVVGSDAKLGDWNPSGALKLGKNEAGQWTGTIVLEQDIILKFRYFIGYFLETGEPNKPPLLIISRWETHLTPRSVLPAVEASKSRVCRANVNDIFGFHGGREMLTDGWISNEEQNTIVLTVSGAALKFYKPRHIQQLYRLKIIPLDLRNKNEMAGVDGEADDGEEIGGEEEVFREQEYPSNSTTQIAPLTHESPMFRDQNEFGELFHNSSDYFLYRTQSVAVEYLSFRIEAYVAQTNELFAIGYALPSTLQDTFGKASVPLQGIKSKGVPVGKIYFGYLFVRPSRLSQPQTMVASYAKHWKKRRYTMEVGHRGMGNSYTKCAVARENTLHSLVAAATAGADLVEFDVHLSKDKIPIIFHDFHVVVSVAKRSPSIAEEPSSRPVSDASSINSEDERMTTSNPVDFYQLAVKDLKLNQLRLLHLDHVTQQYKERSRAVEEEATTRVTGSHDEAEEHRPFPALSEAFRAVPEDVGFNVEVKYPMLQANGVHECENYFERNEFLDIILANVLDNAGKRRIVFSSFDPDICTMLSLKQNKYPVLFLCIGDSSRHVAFVDERTSTSMTAVKFAAGTGLIGVDFNSEDLLRDPKPIYKAKEYGLISFVWGDELLDRKNVDYFKKTLLVEGVIYDRIGEGESRSNVFSLEKKLKAALFNSKKLSPQGQPRSSSITQINQAEAKGFSASNGLDAVRGRGVSISSTEWPHQVMALRSTDDIKITRHNSSGNFTSSDTSSTNSDSVKDKKEVNGVYNNMNGIRHNVPSEV